MGYKHTPEARKKMRQKKLGRKLSAEHRANIGKGVKGLKRTAEQRARMSEVQRNLPPEVIEAKSAKISKKLKGKKQTPSMKKRRPHPLRGTKISPETREKIRQTKLNQSPETRKKISEKISAGLRAAWAAKRKQRKAKE
ncbi:MAG: hypothetical protein ACR2P5_04280 [Gammaproteobacteria bacterium]